MASSERPSPGNALPRLGAGEAACGTTGFRDIGWLDEEGTPVTTAGRMTERFRRPNYGTLEIEATIDDPKAFTKPWTVKLQQRLMPDTDLIEFVCLGNNRSTPHLVGKYLPTESWRA